MSNPQKKSRRKAPPAAPVITLRDDVVGKLPGDTKAACYWESRVAAWLGVARKRVTAMRRRALKEGVDWIVHEQDIVYTEAGIQKLRNFLRNAGAVTAPDKPAESTEPVTDETPAPVGPPKRAKATVVRIYPNNRLMQVLPEGEKSPVLCKVRDNQNFMPRMVLEVVHDPRAEMWQHVGRLPRRRGKW